MIQQTYVKGLTVFQQTLKQEISVSGVGLHSGQVVNLKIKPATVNSGIQFCRVDLDEKVTFRVDPLDITDTQLCTVVTHTLPSGLVAKIGTVEHILSALAGLNIDNVIIEIDADEIPIVDGSSSPFVYLIQEVGIKVQNALRQYLRILKPVSIKVDDKWAKLSPSQLGFQVDFGIDFNHPAIRETKCDFSALLSSQVYIKEISRARTFGFLKDIEFLRQHNLALGGSLDNAVVLDEYRVVNDNGLRYDDEFVRHKALDAIGDLYVCGMPMLGHYEGFKSGHALNNMLLRALIEDKSAFTIESLSLEEASDSLLSDGWATFKS